MNDKDLEKICTLVQNFPEQALVPLTALIVSKSSL